MMKPLDKRDQRRKAWLIAICLLVLLGSVAGFLVNSAQRGAERQRRDRTSAENDRQRNVDNLANKVRTLLEAGHVSSARETLAKVESLGASSTILQELNNLLAKTVTRQEVFQRFAQASVAREKAQRIKRDSAFGILMDEMELAWRAAEAARASGVFGESLSGYKLVLERSREILEADLQRNQTLSASNAVETNAVVVVTNQAKQVNSLAESALNDGITAAWKKKYGFDIRDMTMAKADRDNDGFSNLEEYRANTDPLDPKSHPDVLSKLRVWAIKQQVFKLRYTGGMRIGSNETFQLNWPNGRTLLVKVGETVDGYRVVAHEPRSTDGDVLILEKGAEKLRLPQYPFNKKIKYSATLILLLDRTSYSVGENSFWVVIRKTGYSIINITTNAVTMRRQGKDAVDVEVPFISDAERSEVLSDMPTAPVIKAVFASSETNAEPAQLAIDGDVHTKWSSLPDDNPWFIADLGSTHKISGAVIYWAAAHPIYYTLQVSSDRIHWIEAEDTNARLKSGRTVHMFKTIPGRYLRVYDSSVCVPSRKRKIAINEIQVMVDGHNPPPPPELGQP